MFGISALLGCGPLEDRCELGMATCILAQVQLEDLHLQCRGCLFLGVSDLNVKLLLWCIWLCTFPTPLQGWEANWSSRHIAVVHPSGCLVCFVHGIYTHLEAMKYTMIHCGSGAQFGRTMAFNHFMSFEFWQVAIESSFAV